MSAVSNFDSVMANLGITKSATSDASTTKTKASGNALDQSAFLSLLTAQLKNQDPTAPVDNSQMISQMAQMSTVSGIAQMNTTLSGISSALGSSSASQALDYVGKTVLVDGSTAYPNTDGTLTAETNLDNAASDVQVQISDAQGNPLRTFSMGAQKAGAVEIDWDGKTDSGAAAGNGPFTIKALAVTPGGSTALNTQVWAPVTSVTLASDGSAPTLSVLGIGQTPLTAVHQVG